MIAWLNACLPVGRDAWKSITGIFLLIVFTLSCEKDITVTIPAVSPKVVVEGHIEPGQPPYIILTRSTGYFAPQAGDFFANIFVHDATVIVSDGAKTDTLTEYCASELDSNLVHIISEFMGVPEEVLVSSEYCIYSVDFFDFITGNAIMGAEGKGYSLTIFAEGDTLSSYTTIPWAVAPDSVWFAPQKGWEPYGWIWARLSDPDTMGNSYRWFAKMAYESNFAAASGSAFTDQFFNGQTIDFFYDKTFSEFSDTSHDDMTDHMYKPGDTVIIKFTSIDYYHYTFVRTFETALYTNSDPFASPAQVKTNIKGGLGIWGGYGVSYDTVYAK